MFQLRWHAWELPSAAQGLPACVESFVVVRLHPARPLSSSSKPLCLQSAWLRYVSCLDTELVPFTQWL